MMNIVRKFSIFVTNLLLPLFTPSLAFAAVTPFPTVFIGAPQGSVPADAIDITKIPQFILNLLFLVGIIIAISFLIFGGIRWILSRGDKAAVDAARSHIVAAIVGLIIVVAAFVIVSLVFGLLGVNNPLSGGAFQLPTLKNPGPTQAP